MTNSSFWLLPTLPIFFTYLTFCHAIPEKRQVYIVYLDGPAGPNYRADNLRILARVLKGSPAEECLIYSYKEVLNGFAAKLSAREAKLLAGLPKVISVVSERKYQIQPVSFFHSPTTQL